jgi:LPS sulfotransferase NodH
VAPNPYLICTLPRAGGWLLGEGLRRLGAAGVPDEYFADDLRAHFHRSWELPADCGDAAYLDRVASAATSPDGVFGAIVQWNELERLVQMLLPQADELLHHPSEPPMDHQLVEARFPGVRYVLLTRQDKAAQAVAWTLGRDDRNLDFDPETIAVFERRLTADEWHWVSYFARGGIEPLVITYEQLVADYDATVRSVLGHVGVEAPSHTGVTAPEVIALDDARSNRWRDDYVDWRRQRRIVRVVERHAVEVANVGRDPGVR